jgi:hypothetical protein
MLSKAATRYQRFDLPRRDIRNFAIFSAVGTVSVAASTLSSFQLKLQPQ